jgi:hypothetical protein
MDLFSPLLLATAALWVGWGIKLCWEFRDVFPDRRYELSLVHFVLYWMLGPILAPLLWLGLPLASWIAKPNDAEPTSWDFFLSYSHWDCLWASALYGVIRFSGGRVFLDFVVINRGRNWQPIAEKGIKGSNIFLLLDSIDSRASANVGHEIAFRRRTYRARGRTRRDRCTPDSSLALNVARGLPTHSRRDGILTLGPIHSIHPDWIHETRPEYHSKLIGNLPGWLEVNLPAVQVHAQALGLPCPPRDALEALMTDYLILAAEGRMPLTEGELRERNEQLLEAAHRGDLERVRQLIQIGADVNTRVTLRNETPLTLAAAHGHLEVVRFLLASGAQVNASGRRNRRALIWAAKEGHHAIVLELLGASARVDSTDQHDMTALMWAAKGGYTDIVKALVAAGADVKLKDSNQQTALYRARRTDIIDILKGAGASE